MTYKSYLAALGIFGLVAGTSSAQEPQEQQQRPRQEQPQRMEAGAHGPYILSDDFIGTDIVTAQGETMTSVEQLVIERESGEVKYVIADLGGFLGMGEREIAIPWDQLQMTSPDRVVFNKTADELRTAPEFDEQEFLGMENLAEWERRVKEFFGGEPEERSAVQHGAEQQTERVGRLNRPLFLSDHLIGTNIENQQDENLGSVDELLIERESGRVAYVVTDVGGFLGVGAREVAVPWHSLQFTGEEEIVLARAEDLENAPEFDEQEFWGMTNVAEWEREVEQFFGAEAEDPEPARRTAERERTTEPTPERERQPQERTAEQQETQQQDPYDRGKRETMTVRISEAPREAELGNVPRGVVLKVSSEERGEPMTVYLAPKSYIDQIGLNLKQGQEVEIRGSKVEVDGQEAFFADQITIKLRDEEGKPLWDKERRPTQSP